MTRTPTNIKELKEISCHHADAGSLPTEYYNSNKNYSTLASKYTNVVLYLKLTTNHED